MKRKEFIKKCAVGGSILLTAPVVFSSCADDDETINSGDSDNNNNSTTGTVIDLTKNDFSALKTVGGFAYKDNIIIFRTGDTNYVALSKLCTHSQCTITYSHSDSNLPCPCHGSKFSTSGAVLNGPAASNLKKYTVKLEGNTLKLT